MNLDEIKARAARCEQCGGDGGVSVNAADYLRMSSELRREAARLERIASLSNTASKRGPITDRIRLLLGDVPSMSMTVKEIMCCIGADNVETVRKALQRLLAKGRIERTAFGRYCSKEAP